MKRNYRSRWYWWFLKLLKKCFSYYTSQFWYFYSCGYGFQPSFQWQFSIGVLSLFLPTTCLLFWSFSKELKLLSSLWAVFDLFQWYLSCKNLYYALKYQFRRLRLPRVLSFSYNFYYCFLQRHQYCHGNFLNFIQL